MMSLFLHSSPFILEYDANGVGLGAVLMQGGRLIAYYSQAFKGKSMAMSTYDSELLAVVSAMQK